jgi:hypothetical protein
MTAPKEWPARLSKDGRRVLCGRCGAVLAPWPAVNARPIIPPGSGLHEDPLGSGRFAETHRVRKLYAVGDRRAGQPIAPRGLGESKYLSDDAGGETKMPTLPWSRRCPAPKCRVWGRIGVDTIAEAMRI